MVELRNWYPEKTAPQHRPLFTKIDDGIEPSHHHLILQKIGTLWYNVGEDKSRADHPTHWSPT